MDANQFGLTDRPFQLTPDARYYFESRTHKKAMAYLGYGLAQGEGFIVITGDVGAGKSTLVAHLMATIDRARLNAIDIVSTQVEGDDMLRLVAQKLGMASDGVSKARLLELVEGELGEVAASGRRTLLIVDEAQNLGHSAIEELRMLSNFQVNGQALIQIFLLGQPEFRDAMAASDGLEQVRQRVIATHHLRPMEESEVEPYILHRLRVAGWSGHPDFAPEAFAALFAHSDGIPRRINQIATRLLLHAAVENAELIDADAVDAVIADMSAEVPIPAMDQPLFAVAGQRPAADMPSGPQLEQRIADLENRLEQQEKAVRRVLTLLVDWIEAGSPISDYRDTAA